MGWIEWRDGRTGIVHGVLPISTVGWKHKRNSAMSSRGCGWGMGLEEILTDGMG